MTMKGELPGAGEREERSATSTVAGKARMEEGRQG